MQIQIRHRSNYYVNLNRKSQSQTPIKMARNGSNLIVVVQESRVLAYRPSSRARSRTRTLGYWITNIKFEPFLAGNWPFANIFFSNNWYNRTFSFWNNSRFLTKRPLFTSIIFWVLTDKLRKSGFGKTVFPTDSEK